MPTPLSGSAEESERLLGSTAGGEASSSSHDAPAAPPAEPAADASDPKPTGVPQVLVIPSSASPLGKAGGRPSGHGRTLSSESASSSDSSAAGKDKGKEIALCRICLEEDAAANLEVPCGCAGTQRYAHHACIQRWIDEKGHLRCEICEQTYRGQYTVPPPGPALDDLTMFSPMFIRVDGDRAPMDRPSLDFLDESDHYYQRNPAASWCFTFVIFIMFLVVLHHTMLVADGMDVDSDGQPAGGSSGVSGADDYAASLTLFLFWIGTKAFLIGIPLYTVMRIAARQARREQYEAMMRSGSLDTATRNVLYRLRMRHQDAGGRPGAPGGGPPGAGVV